MRPIIALQGDIKALIKKLYNIDQSVIFTKPPSIEHGDISFPLFSIAKKLDIHTEKIGLAIKKELETYSMIKDVNVSGGFLNIFFDKEFFSKLVLSNIFSQVQYGSSELLSKDRVIVEHTSSNPNGPLHIGNFRGSVIGDVIARIYRTLGASVNVRYYVNDLGRQIAPTVVGYRLLKKEGIKPDCKIDLWIGKIYATMNTLLEIYEIKKKLLYLFKDNESFSDYPFDDLSPYEMSEKEKDYYIKNITLLNLDEDEKDKIIFSLNKFYNVQSSLKDKIFDLYSNLLSLVTNEVKDLSNLAKYYVEAYLKGDDKDVVNSFRELTELALSGHVETLHSFGIYHDDFDRESDIAWSGEIEIILDKLEEKGWLRHDGKARLLKNDEIATALRYKEKYNINYKIPDLILVNSNGVPLYPCRDIAYHLHKLEKFSANKCINVIGKQQQALQLGVKLALYALNKSSIADKIYHFDYEYVTLVGRKMAGRELEYVTPDELYDKTREEVMKLLEDKNYSKKKKEEIANKVAIASVKFSILKIDPQKAVVFDVKKAVDINENSGPFLQYSFTRALNIIEKIKDKGFELEENIKELDKYILSVTKKEEWQLIKTMEELPSVYERAIKNKRPDIITNFAFDFAKNFNKFYDNCPVIAAKTEIEKKTRLLIVQAAIKCFESLFEVMGIDKLDKM